MVTPRTLPEGASFIEYDGLTLRHSQTLTAITPSHLAARAVAEFYLQVLAKAIYDHSIGVAEQSNIFYQLGPFTLSFVADTLEKVVPWDFVVGFAHQMVLWTNLGVPDLSYNFSIRNKIDDYEFSMRYITEGSGREERRLANKKISGDIAHMENDCLDPETQCLHELGEEIVRIEGLMYHFSQLAYLSFTMKGPYTLVATGGDVVDVSWSCLPFMRTVIFRQLLSAIFLEYPDIVVPLGGIDVFPESYLSITTISATASEESETPWAELASSFSQRQAQRLENGRNEFMIRHLRDHSFPMRSTIDTHLPTCSQGKGSDEDD
ncbi:5-azacytidine resistance protein azr1 [Physcia stellaris]|nr:5-azacytidine resistance protein azr1 [Physcia stellaris]